MIVASNLKVFLNPASLCLLFGLTAPQVLIELLPFDGDLMLLESTRAEGRGLLYRCKVF